MIPHFGLTFVDLVANWASEGSTFAQMTRGHVALQRARTRQLLVCESNGRRVSQGTKRTKREENLARRGKKLILSYGRDNNGW